MWITANTLLLMANQLKDIMTPPTIVLSIPFQRGFLSLACLLVKRLQKMPKAKKKKYITGAHGSGSAMQKAKYRKQRANRHK